MGRYNEVDILKGIAVVCMVIFHIVYFPSQYGYKEFKDDTKTLLLIAKIAQVIFITCVGVNMYISYHNSKEKGESKEEYRKKQLKRILVLAVCALCMTLFSYYVFGEDKFIKFGILHFISFSSLLLFMFVGQPKVIISLLVFVTALFTLKNMNPSLFLNVNPKIAFISGFYSKWNAIDHFPLVPWLILICFGILVGDVFLKYKPQIDKQYSKIFTPLQEIGKKSLEIYMVHWIVLYIFFIHLYPKYFQSGENFISNY